MIPVDEAGEPSAGAGDPAGPAAAATRPVFVVGSVNVDVVYRVDALPLAGETVLATAPQSLGGGKGANQASAAARLGADTRLIGCVGDDEAGRHALAGLRAAGIDVHGVHRRGPRTGAAIVLVDPRGENAIVVSPGANRLLTPEDVAAVFDGARGGIVLLSLEIPVETAEAAAVAAVAAGLTVILNPAPAQRLSRRFLGACDVLVPNEHELAELGRPGVDDLLAAGVGAVVVTLGARGADLHRAGQETVHVPAFDVDAVDTTGAGDAFCGALAVALAAGEDLGSAVTAAAAVGALATRARGARGSLPTPAEVALLRSGRAVSAA